MTTPKCPRSGIPSQYCSCTLHDRIGGKLSADAYAQLAAKHRPQYRDDMAAAARDLAARGLKSHDIAPLLGVGVDAVTALLESPNVAAGASRGDEAAAIHREVWTKRGDHG